MLPFIEADLTSPPTWCPSEVTSLRTPCSLRSRDPQLTADCVRSVFQELDIESVRIDTNEETGVAVYWAMLRHRFLAGDAQPFWNFGGKGFSPLHAEVSLMVECIERVTCSRLYHPELITASLREVKTSEGCVGIPKDSIDLDEAQEWGWAVNLQTCEAKLVHASLLLSPYRPLYGSSLCASDYNGIAAGNSVEEAILHGLCELMERDLLIRVSYHRPILPRIDPKSIIDEDCRTVIEHFLQRNAELAIWDLTCNSYLRTFGAMVFDAGFVTPVSPLVCGTHPDADIALARCLSELCQIRANTIFVTESAPVATTRMASRNIKAQFFAKNRLSETTELKAMPNVTQPDRILQHVTTLIDCLRKDNVEIYMSRMGSIPGVLEIIRVNAIGLQPLTSNVEIIGDQGDGRFSDRRTERLLLIPRFERFTKTTGHAKTVLSQ